VYIRVKLFVNIQAFIPKQGYSDVDYIVHIPHRIWFKARNWYRNWFVC